MTQLSLHFSLAELTDSQTAVRRGIDNTPAPDIVGNLARVAAVLERVRALVGGPIVVSSGYRSPAVNKAVGGSASSAHVHGLAADITSPILDPKRLAIVIRDGGIEFDQLIYEGTWVHIGLSAGAPRKEVLTAKFAGGRASYSKGIA